MIFEIWACALLNQMKQKENITKNILHSQQQLKKHTYFFFFFVYCICLVRFIIIFFLFLIQLPSAFQFKRIECYHVVNKVRAVGKTIAFVLFILSAWARKNFFTVNSILKTINNVDSFGHRQFIGKEQFRLLFSNFVLFWSLFFARLVTEVIRHNSQLNVFLFRLTDKQIKKKIYELIVTEIKQKPEKKNCKPQTIPN